MMTLSDPFESFTPSSETLQNLATYTGTPFEPAFLIEMHLKTLPRPLAESSQSRLESRADGAGIGHSLCYVPASERVSERTTRNLYVVDPTWKTMPALGRS